MTIDQRDGENSRVLSTDELGVVNGRQQKTKGSAFDQRQERDMAFLPYGRQLLSAPELASRYRGILAMHFRQFVAALLPWVIYEHRNLTLLAMANLKPWSTKQRKQ